jgi:hypothetical protein
MDGLDVAAFPAEAKTLGGESHREGLRLGAAEFGEEDLSSVAT